MNFLYALESDPFWGDIVLTTIFLFLLALIFAKFAKLEHENLCPLK